MTRTERANNPEARRAYWREWRAKNAAKYAATAKAWAERNPGRFSEIKKSWIERNPEKKRCHSAVNHAIRDGLLTRKPCEVCGAKAQAHHDDYSKPLEVCWLCSKHHTEHHRKAA